MRGGASRLYSIFLRSVWQMPQAFHADQDLAGPDGGSRDLFHGRPCFAGVDGGVHGVREWRSDSESSSRQENLPALERRCRTASIQLDQFREHGRGLRKAAARILDRLKRPSGSRSLIEIQRKVSSAVSVTTRTQ